MQNRDSGPAKPDFFSRKNDRMTREERTAGVHLVHQTKAIKNDHWLMGSTPCMAGEISRSYMYPLPTAAHGWVRRGLNSIPRHHGNRPLVTCTGLKSDKTSKNLGFM